MDTFLANEPIIDHEVRAYVLSLCSALGGPSAGDDGRYVLGDDALAVLKDIKRWLKLYDDKLARLDVARLLAEANLVKGDLLEVLASWPEDTSEGSFRQKIALASVDLLTMLTWPIDKDEQTTTMHRYMHIPYLQKAQVSYKSAILHYDGRDMLRTIVRVALPALAESRDERSPYQDSIIKVVLFLFRNIAMITHPQDVVVDEVESDVSRSATILAFEQQDIFSLILTLCSSMHEDFYNHDVEAMETVFHIVKGVDVEDLFMDSEDLISGQTKELQGLLSKEKGLLAGYARHAPSRHNRFGSMLWIKRDDERFSTVFGQRGAGSAASGVAELDKRKQWKRARRNPKPDTSETSSAAFDTTVFLTSAARRCLRIFVEQFLDSSFNPLFLAVRKAIEREAPRVTQAHTRQYLYLVSWFLRAECARRKKQAERASQQPPNSTSAELDSFSLVAAVMNQETFVLLNRVMQRAQDDKNWQDLNAGMKCFTQILLTVQEMSDSPLDEDQEISENILNRIFYEQTTHDRIIALLRTYKDQGFGYLDACTELAHVFIRLLERYSKQNVDMQVRSRRRARRKKKTETTTTTQQPDGPTELEHDREMEAEDVAEAHRTSTERKFDFVKFAAKFINEASVSTFVAFLRYYQDLSVAQLKRVHRFFHRVAFKMEKSTYLFRMDIILLFNKLIKGPNELDLDNPTFKDWEELVKQVFRKLTKRLDERPAMFVELLFSKLTSTLFYLEHGYDKELPKRASRRPAELEVKPGIEPDERVGVAVSILINQSKADAIAWLRHIITLAAAERKAWEDANTALDSIEQVGIDDGAINKSPEVGSEHNIEGNPTTDTEPGERDIAPQQPKPPSIFVKADDANRRESLTRDKYLRLLLSVLNFEDLSSVHVGEDDSNNEASWIVPSAIDSKELTRLETLIGKFEFDPPTYNEGAGAEDMVRRKTAAARSERRRRQTESDSEGDSGPDVEHMFPAGGPNIHQRSHSPENRAKRKRSRHQPDEFLDESVLEARREARRKLEAERRGKIKSTLFVHDSDDDTDEERDEKFFAREEERRKAVQKRLIEEMTNSREEREAKDGETKRNGKSRRRKRAIAVDNETDNDDDNIDSRKASNDGEALETSKPRKRIRSDSNGSSNASSAETVSTAGNTPMKQSGALESTDENDSSAETDTDTPQSSQGPVSAPANSREARDLGLRNEDVSMTDAEQGSDSDKENTRGRSPKPGPAVQQQRRNMRAGFIIDSDSDE